MNYYIVLNTNNKFNIIIKFILKKKIKIVKLVEYSASKD